MLFYLKLGADFDFSLLFGELRAVNNPTPKEILVICHQHNWVLFVRLALNVVDDARIATVEFNKGQQGEVERKTIDVTVQKNKQAFQMS